MGSLLDELEAGQPSPSRKKKKQAGSGNRSGGPDKRGRGAFQAANGVPTGEVLDWLGVEHDEKYARCPGCGEDGALICENGGIKCLHNRCADAGPEGYPGFRTNVDIVAVVRGVEPSAAAKLICDRFDVGSRQNSEPAESNSAPVELRPLGDLLGQALDRAERRRTGDEKPVPVPFAEWAEALGGGLWPGAHYMVSGTGVGKSQLAIQTALGAAATSVPTLYVGLELDEAQIALRVLGERIGTSWSKLYLGKCTVEELQRARKFATPVAQLPFYADFGPPRGWPPSRLFAVVEKMRQRYPVGPLLVVLDYLQLVGNEPGEGWRPDLRERVGNAAYSAREVARRFDASVLVISSAARNAYGLLAGDVKKAGFATRPAGKDTFTRPILQPSVLIGLGKESGEVEFSADSVTVLIRWPAAFNDFSTPMICAVPKFRASEASWLALCFKRGSFCECPIKSLDDLPKPEKTFDLGGGSARERVSDSDMEGRVFEAARKNPHFTSMSKLAGATKGTRTVVLAAIKRLIAAGRLEITKAGTVVRNEPKGPNA